MVHEEGCLSSPAPWGPSHPVSPPGRAPGEGTPVGLLVGAESPGAACGRERLRGVGTGALGCGACSHAACMRLSLGKSPLLVGAVVGSPESWPQDSPLRACSAGWGGPAPPTQHSRQVPPAPEPFEAVGGGDHPGRADQGAPAQQRPVQLQHGLVGVAHSGDDVMVTATWGSPPCTRVGAAGGSASVQVRGQGASGPRPERGNAGLGSSALAERQPGPTQRSWRFTCWATLPSLPQACSLTCQGHSPLGQTWPPTIRPWGLLPFLFSRTGIFPHGYSTVWDRSQQDVGEMEAVRLHQ